MAKNMINAVSYGSARHCNVCVQDVAEKIAANFSELTQDNLEQLRTVVEPPPDNISILLQNKLNLKNVETSLPSRTEDTTKPPIAKMKSRSMAIVSTALAKSKEPRSSASERNLNDGYQSSRSSTKSSDASTKLPLPGSTSSKSRRKRILKSRDSAGKLSNSLKEHHCDVNSFDLDSDESYTEVLKMHKLCLNMDACTAVVTLDVPECERIVTCNGCNMIQYCSHDHKQSDWKLHMEFCRVMKYVKRLCKVSHPLLINGPLNAKNFQLSTAQLKTIFYVRTCRPPNARELELLSYPAVCAVCYKLTQLQHCNYCQGISYCSEEHRIADFDRHVKECNTLRLHYTAFKLVSLKHNTINEFSVRTVNLQDANLFSAFEHTTRLQIPQKPTLTYLHYHGFAVASSFSWIATLCLGMSYLDVPRTKTECYTIYIIGATDEQRRYFQLMHMRFFFLHNEKVTKVKLYFIGPEVMATDTEIRIFEFKGRQCTVVYQHYMGLFQEFVKQTKCKPDLIIAFNPDFSERNKIQVNIVQECLALTSPDEAAALPAAYTWPDAIEELMHTHHVPIFFTSPTELEAKLDYCALLEGAERCKIKVNIMRMFNFGKNLYADMIPQRNMRRGEAEPIYYRNGYLQGIFTTL